MKTKNKFRVTMIKVKASPRLPAPPKRKSRRVARSKRTINATAVVRALKAAPGAKALIARAPSLGIASLWFPIATFSIAGKTGTAISLDLMKTDHSGWGDTLQNSLANRRALYLDSGTATVRRRIICRFSVPWDGAYVCNVGLQKAYVDGPAPVVKCKIDAFWYPEFMISTPGGVPVNRPHPAWLPAGDHRFEVWHTSGSFHFLDLTVFKLWELASV